MRWWFVDRLVAVWETVVGSLISGTWLANLFYLLMGTDCPLFLASIETSLREFDLVTIGSDAKIRGKVYCRSFAPNRVWFAPVAFGKRCTVESLAVVMPGCVVGEDCTIAPLGVLLESTKTRPNSVYSGNPAFMVEKKDVMPQLMDAGSMAYEACISFIKGLTVLWMMYVASAVVVAVYVEASEVDASLGGIHHYLPLFCGIVAYFGGAIVVAGLSICLKWMLLGKVRPGVVQNSFSRRLRTCIVDSSARMALWMLNPWIRRSPMFNLYYRLLGMRLPVFASSIGPGFVSPSGADLVTLGGKVFAASGVCKTERDLGNGNVELCECVIGTGSTLGLWAVCGPGLVCGYGSVVGIATHARDSVPDGAMMIGNPPVVLDSSAQSGDVALDQQWRQKSLKVVGERDGVEVLEQLQRGGDGETIKAQGVSGTWTVCPPTQRLVGVEFWVIGMRSILVRVALSFLFILCASVPGYQALVQLQCPGSAFGLDDACHPAALILMSTPLTVGTILITGLFGTLSFFSHFLRVILSNRDNMRLPISSVGFLMYSELLVFSVLIRDNLINPLFSGSHIMRMVYSVMGARLGDNVYLSDTPLLDCHKMTIGDSAILDGTECQGHVLVAGILSTAKTTIGRGCILQPGSAVFGGDNVEDGALVGPRTKAMPGQILSSREHWHGVPASAVQVRARHLP